MVDLCSKIVFNILPCNNTQISIKIPMKTENDKTSQYQMMRLTIYSLLWEEFSLSRKLMVLTLQPPLLPS